MQFAEICQKAMQDRLALDEKRIEGIANACEKLTALDDPVGQIESGSVRPNGMRITKSSCANGRNRNYL